MSVNELEYTDESYCDSVLALIRVRQLEAQGHKVLVNTVYSRDCRRIAYFTLSWIDPIKA
jgi:hypothetical protein